MLLTLVQPQHRGHTSHRGLEQHTDITPAMSTWIGPISRSPAGHATRSCLDGPKPPAAADCGATGVAWRLGGGCGGSLTRRLPGGRRVRDNCRITDAGDQVDERVHVRLRGERVDEAGAQDGSPVQFGRRQEAAPTGLDPPGNVRLDPVRLSGGPVMEANHAQSGGVEFERRVLADAGRERAGQVKVAVYQSPVAVPARRLESSPDAKRAKGPGLLGPVLTHPGRVADAGRVVLNTKSEE